MEVQEDNVVDGVQFNLLYQGEVIALPLKMLELKQLSDVINLNVIEKEFNKEEMEELMQLLPQKNMKCLKYAFQGQGLQGNPFTNFERKLKSGYFTSLR